MSVKGSELYISECCIYNSICTQIFVKLLRELNIVIMNFLLYWHFGGGGEIAQWLRRCATNRKLAGSIPAGVSGFFIDITSFRSHYGPGIDPASNVNEYQEYFLGEKEAGA